MIGGSDFARKSKLNNLFYNINLSIESMCLATFLNLVFIHVINVNRFLEQIDYKLWIKINYNAQLYVTSSRAKICSKNIY